MKVKCDYCDNYIDETDEQCPHCGAPNEHMTRSGHGVPKTIKDLLAFAQAHNMPLEKMRFFIGKDYREPRAFGIYLDDEGNYVVYKNKANGERVVRYRGDDEAYAVNEIYQKMRSEVFERKQATGPEQPSKPKKPHISTVLLIAARVVLIGIVIGLFVFTAYFIYQEDSKSGYYRYDDAYYYYDGGWYLSSGDDWIRTNDVPSELDSNYSDYFESKDYDDVSDSGISEYVVVTDDDDWDSDDWDDDDWDDWDSDGWDSWDSSDTDWDSDW